MGFEKERGVLGIQTEPGFSFLRVTLDDQQAREASALQVLRPLSGEGLCIRFVKIFSDCFSGVIPRAHLPTARAALAGAEAAFEVQEDCAVVTVVAPNMRSIPSLMARMGEALSSRTVEVFQTADSHSSVSCVISAERMADAVEALRGEFGIAEESE
jgi:aspartate kinase